MIGGPGERAVYLGDGVSVSSDGFHLVLTVEAGTVVYLDPGVFWALRRYAASIDFPGSED